MQLTSGIPNKINGLTPSEIFTGTQMDNKNLRTEKTWGCPAYVLDPKLQDGKRLPKWSPRTRKGQYLGKSPLHASTVGIIRNLTTGFISPQFHVIYDTKFETVSRGYEDNGAVTTHIWDLLAQDQRTNTLEELTFEQQHLPNLHRYWLSPEEKEEMNR